MFLKHDWYTNFEGELGFFVKHVLSESKGTELNYQMDVTFT